MHPTGEDLSTFLARGIGVVSADCFVIGEGDCDFAIKALRDVLLDEDIDFACSGLKGSRSFTLLLVCRLWITDFDGRLSLALAPALVDEDRVCRFVFGAEPDLCFEDDDVDGFGFLSSSVVAESTDIANASSAVDSPAAGIATSPPKVMVVSALDPDVTVDACFDVKLHGRQSIRPITCVRV